MSGVEAAASLFGSEGPFSDPFATLGSDGTPAAIPEASDKEDLNNNSLSSWEHSGDSSPANLQSHVPATQQTVAVSTTTSYHPNAYTPQVYTPVHHPKQPPSSYAPPVSTYTRYHPPLSNSPQVNSSSTVDNMPYIGSGPSHHSTINRPKLSNAYDPPFLPAKPNRRAGGTPEVQQYYGVYQAPTPPAPHNTTATYSGGYYPGKPPLREVSRQQSPDVPIHSATTPSGKPPLQEVSGQFPDVPIHSTYSASNPTAPPLRTISSNLDNPGGSASSQHSGFRPTTAELTAFQSKSYEQIAPTTVHLPNGSQEHSVPKGILPPTDSSHHPRSHTPRSSSIGSNSSQTKLDIGRVPSRTTSPATVPLPYSPPAPIVDPPSDVANHQGPSIKPPSQHCPYLPSQLPKKAAGLNDPYAPTVRNTNYIPRTASPLQHRCHSGEPNSIAPAVSNVNGVASARNTISRTMNIPAPLSGVDSVENLSPRHATGLPQEFGLKPSMGQYAPSPSLVGANDPLSRTSTRAPVVTFGFGGKMVTCFHGMPGLNAGFDVALSARTSSELKVRILQKILPESVLGSPAPPYPGPLVSDPGAPSLSLVRSGASAQVKAKKSALVTYLLGRAEEIGQGLGYLPPPDRQQAENKLILVKVLKALVENDGRLFGTPQAESAVRAALVPRLSDEPTLQDGVTLQAAYQTAVLDESPISVTSLRPSILSKIEEFLLQGDRRQAVHYAADQKLWAHAMIIASSIDKDAWKEVVNDFLHKELNASDEPSRGPNATTQSSKKTWESLRVTYSFFSGQGAAAIQELAPPILLQRPAGVLQPVAPSLSAATPRTPNFAAMQPLLSVPPEKLSKWAEAVAMMISSPFTPTPEAAGALAALGDQLLANNWIEAAHACYLLSPYIFSSQPPLINGFGAPGSRINLVGSTNPAIAFKNPDSLLFSEILEFALSLLPPAKGQEPFHGLPHLQVYRFVRAVWLAEMGDVQLASRYCEAIAASLNPSSPYTTTALLEQLQGLQQRLTGVFHGEKSNSWIGAKLSKPSLDSIGGWLEGRFTKLVTGDNDLSSANDDQAKSSDQQFVGPFAHYSTISSPSSRSSPQPTTPNINQFPPPPMNAAIGNSLPYGVPTRPQLPVQPSTYSSQSSPMGISYSREPESPKSPDNMETAVTNSWWSDATSRTPTASTFLTVQENTAQANSDGFISLMDNESFAFESKQAISSASSDMFDDEEDLGFGNPKAKPKPEKEAEKEKEGRLIKETVTPAEKPADKPPAPTPASNGGSWLGRFFRRSDTTSTGPVKANLGEVVSLVYDKDLKKWVDKKAGSEGVTPPAPPAPPPRAQTASPGMSASRAPAPPSTGLGPPRAASAGAEAPPPRPTSALDLTTEPPTKVLPPRIRSNLAPPTAETVPGQPLSSAPGVAGGPPARPRSQAAKRNIRSRYVDVFQQENGGAANPS